jgi:hypothetical protein
VFKFILLPELNRILAWFTTVVPVLNQVFYRLQTAFKQILFYSIDNNSITVCCRTNVNRTKTRYRNRSKTRFVYSKCAEKQNTRCFTRYLCLQCGNVLQLLKVIQKPWEVIWMIFTRCDKVASGLGATNLLLLILLLILHRTPSRCNKIWIWKIKCVTKFDNLLTIFWWTFNNFTQIFDIFFAQHFDQFLKVFFIICFFPSYQLKLYMVVASCCNKYYRTNFNDAVPTSHLIAPGLWTI